MPAADAGHTGRLTGVDAARGLALLGMMAVHLLPAEGDDGSLSLTFRLASGRASALFAVLAGVSLALAGGGARPPPAGPARNGARRAVVARAAVVAAVGLTLGSLDPPVAVILGYYALLFCLAVPVLGWPARRLAVLAAVCAVGAPVLSQLARSRFGTDVANLGWHHLADPEYLLGTAVLTGYYPVLTWTAYLFAGMAVGRSALGRPRTAARLVVVGGVLTAVGPGAAAAASQAAGGTAALAGRLGRPPETLDRTLGTTMYGTTPTTSWWWLLLDGRHSGSTPDLVGTGGSALLVLGCCLLVVPRLGRFAPLARPFALIGATTLTLYTLHVLVLPGMIGGGAEDLSPRLMLTIHVALVLVVAAVIDAPARRGPLEALAAAAAGLVNRSRGPAPGAPAPGRSAPGPPATGGDGARSDGTPPG